MTEHQNWDKGHSPVHHHLIVVISACQGHIGSVCFYPDIRRSLQGQKWGMNCMESNHPFPRVRMSKDHHPLETPLLFCKKSVPACNQGHGAFRNLLLFPVSVHSIKAYLAWAELSFLSENTTWASKQELSDREEGRLEVVQFSQGPKKRPST